MVPSQDHTEQDVDDVYVNSHWRRQNGNKPLKNIFRSSVASLNSLAKRECDGKLLRYDKIMLNKKRNMSTIIIRLPFPPKFSFIINPVQKKKLHYTLQMSIPWGGLNQKSSTQPF